MSVQEVYENTHIDPWFLENIRELSDFEHRIAAAAKQRLIRKPGTSASAEALARERDFLYEAKQLGFSDLQIAYLALRGKPHAVYGVGNSRSPLRAWSEARLQIGGYLRRRVRGEYTVLLFDLRALFHARRE